MLPVLSSLLAHFAQLAFILDLVSSFDETISKCFKDPAVNTETIAPVQVRTEEEIMNESQ